MPKVPDRPPRPEPADPVARRRPALGGSVAGRDPYHSCVGAEVEDLNRRLLRARDAMDRSFAEPLDVRAVAAVAHISPAHFSRCFRTVFGETPHRYLQRRRIERSMFLLRETGRSVTDICFDVGFTSLGTFSRTFREIVGETPSAYRRGHGPIVMPGCVQMVTTRPRAAPVADDRAVSEKSPRATNA
jgi:AraC-like DNA-binding protein